ncbi:MULTISPECIES: surface-adhesin E family protein [Basfia]|uniref:Surface-adhesin protein n=2 Tax=Basfia TaxID=697331 RepID=Q65VN7_MANSM|nr:MULTISPECIES: surface-adhesin E family protein [Basfia]AAU36973.1 unknown [[Mannheimia] succiniciproducens MBEL55E]QIM69748.1 hypothetical protein A4G13_10225 [Basfia succiniciproducens]SCX80527.1 Surface-adhesin protein E [Basfia succiniciproducens]SEQ02731.1 Surface-adhesin protein E [Basfia succiniciproducens]
MKKSVLLFIAASMLVACSTGSISQRTLPADPLLPPSLVQPGFVRMPHNLHYYADINSVWVDSDSKNMIHFDAVINLRKGPHVYSDRDKIAKSMRQAKVVNCDTMKLTHLKTDYYSEFWGTGDPVTPEHQKMRTVDLRKGSSLYTLAQVLCINLYRK